MLALTACQGRTTAPVPGQSSVLRIYTWGDYVSPELTRRFEKKYSIDVTVSPYSGSDAPLQAARTGSGYDVAIATQDTVRALIDQGLVEKTEPRQMENFKNVEPRFVDVYWDVGRHYSVPWQYSITTMAVDVSRYAGSIDSFALAYDPPESLRGKIAVDFRSVITNAQSYLGMPRCTDKPDDLRRLERLIQAAAPYWAHVEKDIWSTVLSGEAIAGQVGNDAAYRLRLRKPSLKFAVVREPMEGQMDNLVVLKGAQNIENARRFQDFIMAPENAALISSHAHSYSAIIDAYKFTPPAMASASEINPPPFLKVSFVPPCPSHTQTLYKAILHRLPL
jgi:spermidine/putrescine transport system substrate-binding protein